MDHIKSLCSLFWLTDATFMPQLLLLDRCRILSWDTSRLIIFDEIKQITQTSTCDRGEWKLESNDLEQRTWACVSPWMRHSAVGLDECVTVRYYSYVCCMRASILWGSSPAVSYRPHAGLWINDWNRVAHCILNSFILTDSDSLLCIFEIACPGVACLPFDLCYAVFLDLI